jgi:hypothetical protein
LESTTIRQFWKIEPDSKVAQKTNYAGPAQAIEQAMGQVNFLQMKNEEKMSSFQHLSTFN